VGAIVAGTLVVAPMAHAQKFHQFYVAGATGHVKAVEDSEAASQETGGQNDKVHVEYSMDYSFVKPRGIYGLGTILVPFSGPAKPTHVVTGGSFVKGSVTTRASGQTWIRTGGGDDTSGHYATWSCVLKPEKFKGNRGFTPVAVGGGRYSVQSPAALAFASQPEESQCTASEPGAVPGAGFEISARRKAARAMVIGHVMSGRELRARKTTLKLKQVAPAPIDCHGGDVVACTDTVSASGTVKLVKACRKPATVGGGGIVSCDDALPEPR
jgi:hypothetical protein